MEGLSVWILKMGDYEYTTHSRRDGHAGKRSMYEGGRLVGVYLTYEDAEAALPRPDRLMGSHLEDDGAIVDRYSDIETWTWIKEFPVHTKPIKTWKAPLSPHSNVFTIGARNAPDEFVNWAEPTTYKSVFNRLRARLRGVTE